MSIYKNAVRKPITTFMIFIGVMVFGVYSLSNLSVDLYPEIEFPTISVFTAYAGAGANDIETNISKPIEDALNTVDNLKEITSVSRDNMSVVSLEFEYETDLSQAANDIRDALSLVEDVLPENAEQPMIFKFSSSMIPVMMFAVTADETYEGIEKILEEKIVNPLNRIEGIGSINIIGAPAREVAVEINPRKLEAYNVTVEQIGNVIRAENLNMPSGKIQMGELSYPLRSEGEFKSSSEIEEIVLGYFNNQPIYLNEIATIRDSIKDKTIDEKINGKPGVRLMILKQSGANTVQVAEELNREMERLKKNLPADVEIKQIFDSSEFIKGSINNLTQTLMFALLFVTLVVLFFLGRWRATFIIILTIPIALIVSFIYLYVTGSSINIISLSALSIAIGMVVDDAIVVLENISKHIERGSSPGEAAIYATNEVWLAVVVTTLTVVAVFFPMTLIGGMTGVMFRQLGWIVSITVVTSTLAAISLTPVLSSKLLKLKKAADKRETWFDKKMKPFFDKMDTAYEKLLGQSIKYRKIILIGAIGIFVASLFMAGSLSTEFFPESDESRFSAAIELQAGTHVDKTVELARKIDKYLADIPEVQLISTSAGSDEEGGFMAIFNSTGENIINYTVRLTNAEDRERSVWEIVESFRNELNKYPEIVSAEINTGGNGMGESSVDVEIYGYNIDQTTKVANELAKEIEKIPGARNVNISREKAKPELRVEPDREKMATVGLNTATVSTAIYNRVAGMNATSYREKGNEYEVVVRFKEEYRNSISDIKNIALQTPSGKKVRLSEIAEVTEYFSPPNIERKRRERVVTVSATPYNTALGDLATQIEKVVNESDIPEGLVAEVGGAYEDQQEGFADIALLLMLSIILVYIVMASQFESLKMPLIIMFSIPFAFTGVILALLITDTTLSMIAALGAVMLIGIVVKNAIVLVDYINLMRDRGMPLNKAIMASGKSRLRPVLMTALTTILGMLPLALSTGEGSEIWSPMGISVIGGLVFSTVITLVIVPVAYRLIAASGERNKQKRIREKFQFMDQ
jgi:HAE1 family hydrophobic/amphiphilic exporter-1